MEGDGLRAEGKFLVLFGLCREQLRFWLLDSFLMSIFTSKSAKVEVWFQLECAPEQLVSVVTANRHFYVATFSLWYPNLIICYSNM